MCNFTLCDNSPMTAKDLYDPGQFSICFFFFLALIKKLVVEQPKLYGQRGENVLKVGIYAQKVNN